MRSHPSSALVPPGRLSRAWAAGRKLLLSAALVGPAAGLAADPPAALPRKDGLVAVVDRVKASVVNIHSERTVNQGGDDPFRPAALSPQRVNGMGSGIVLDPRGYIVTNHHVVDDVQSLRVRLVDGANCPARVVAVDKEADLAIIKIDPPKPLNVVPLGTAQDLMLAETVIAIGNAYGYEHTVTIGHVSAMKRDVTLNKEVSYKSLIQTDTAINPGNSGGPLFNKLGEVVGVNVAIRAGAQNIAFAIPVDSMIVRAADMMSVRRREGLRHGLVAADKVERTTDDLAARRWVTVSRTEPNSPAEAAGFKAGDVVEMVGEVPVSTTIDLERAFLDRPAGTALPVRVRRSPDGSASGEPVTLSLAAAPGGGPTAGLTATEAVWRRAGLRVTPVGPAAVSAIDRQLRGGLLIQEVAVGGPAARAGLVKGDLLIGLHLWESITVDNVLFVMNHKDLESFSPVKAYFVRDGQRRQTLLTNID